MRMACIAATALPSAPLATAALATAALTTSSPLTTSLAAALATTAAHAWCREPARAEPCARHRGQRRGL
jgi:hypothetical protein